MIDRIKNENGILNHTVLSIVVSVYKTTSFGDVKNNIVSLKLVFWVSLYKIIAKKGNL